MVEESLIRATLSRRMVNFMTALAPTLDGLLLITVEDGGKGEIIIRFGPGAGDGVRDLVRYLERAHEGEFRLT